MGSITDLLWRIYTNETGPQLYGRHQNALVREKEPLSVWLANEVMHSWLMDTLDRFHLIRTYLKRRSFHSRTTYSSALQIPAFVDFYGICMTDFIQSNPIVFPNFNEFFIREIRPERRPIASTDDDAIITSAADSRLIVYDSLRQAHIMKGCSFKFHFLLGSRVCHSRPDLLTRFNDDSPVANFRLHPMDYHRFHSPVSGKILMVEHIEGDYYTAKCEASHNNVLGDNTRTIILIETSENEAVLFIPIAAEPIGMITMTVEEGADVVKGDEIGMFLFGGSDILIVFEHDVSWDHDLAQWSSRGIETLVRVNERIGTF